MRRRLVLFAKAPRPGEVKTRLCPPLRPEEAAALAEAFLRDTLELAETLAEHELTLAYSPRGARREMRAQAGPRWRLQLQRGADLGARLEGVLRDLLSEEGREGHHQQGTDSHFGQTTPEMVSVPKAHPELRDGLSEEGREGHRQQGTDSHFGQTTPEMVSVPNGFSPLSPALSGGGDRVLVIGADSPQVPPERLREAAAALDRADLVLGPTDDGGYYALGLRRWAAGLLDGVRWSTEHALADTLSRARALGLSCELLPPAYDVDDAASLWRLVEELEHLPPDRLRHTRAALPAGYRREP